MAQIGRYAASLLCLFAGSRGRLTLRLCVTVSVLVWALATQPAWAQAARLAGFHAGLQASFVSTSGEVHDGPFSGSVGDTDEIASLQLGRGWALGPQGWLGLALSWNMGYLKAGSVGPTAYKLRDTYALTFEPGYMVGDATLLYGRLAYLSWRAEAERAGLRESRDYRGFGYGVGMRVALDSQWFLQLDVMQATCNELPLLGSPFEPVATSGSVGLGWRF